MYQEKPKSHYYTIKYLLYTLFFLQFVLACETKKDYQSEYTFPKATKDSIQTLLKQTKKNMVYIEGGSFTMGFSQKVTLDSFWIGKYEITYYKLDLYSSYKKTKPIKLTLNYYIRYSHNGSMPAGVTWFEARDYCQWLAELSGEAYSLPTEAQWEYAARLRGKQIRYSTDNGQIDFGRNYIEPGYGKLVPVGTFPPNPLGIHEMSGNAKEWVYDWYGKEYYKEAPEYNPKGPKKGLYKILRGESLATWGVPSGDVYSSEPIKPMIIYYATNEKKGYMYSGFRCVKNTK